MKKILITALAFAGFAIAGPNSVTSSNYTTYTNWNKDHFSYYALNDYHEGPSVGNCYYNYGTGTHCNVAAVNNMTAGVAGGSQLGKLYTLKTGSITLWPSSHVDSIYFDSTQSQLSLGYDYLVNLPNYIDHQVPNFTRNKWVNKGMPTSVSELPFTIDTSSANYPVLSDSIIFTNTNDTLKTAYNYKNFIKLGGNLYIPPGEYYFNNFILYGGNTKVKLLNPRKATIIHVRNGAHWSPREYINRATSSDPDIFTHLNKSFLLINHGASEVYVKGLRGSVIAPYSNVIVSGDQYGTVLAKDINLSNSTYLYYVKFNPTSW